MVQHFADNLSIHLDTAGLQRLESHAPGMADRALELLARQTAAQAQQNIRTVGAIDTAFMINTTAARRVKELTWSVGTAADYGVYIEYGTRFVSPRPWLGPAMQGARSTLEKLLKATFRGIGR